MRPALSRDVFRRKLLTNLHTESLPKGQTTILNRSRRRSLTIEALHIDRRAHLERAWQKQKEMEEKLVIVSGLTSNHLPTEVACLSHLERCVEIAGSSIVVVAFYSRLKKNDASEGNRNSWFPYKRFVCHKLVYEGKFFLKCLIDMQSCGACKQMLQHYAEICHEACSQRAGVRFLKHNVRDEFDDVTDIARLYRIKNVPCFVFFSGGALMKSMPMPDSRIDPSSIRRLMGSQAGHLSAVLRQMLFKDTPSARR